MSQKIIYALSQKFPDIDCMSLWTPETYFNQLQTSLPVHQKYLHILNSLNIDTNKTVLAQQVHHNVVLEVNHSGMVKNCDGLITQKNDLYLIVRSADCAAIMIYDRQNQIIANLHAGWRGVYKKIISNCLNMFYKAFDGKKDNIYVTVSPFIQCCCYQVSEEFRSMFARKFFIYRGNLIYFNLKSAIKSELVNMGLSLTQIEISERCTMCDPEFLPSYRRTKTKNRMFSFIGKKYI